MVGYCRVSTGGQARSGLGLADQQAKISSAAEIEGWVIVGWKVDRGETGKNLDRQEFLGALQMVANGEADGLVAAKLDRLARSVQDFAQILEWFGDAKASLVVLDPAIDTATPNGRLVANILASIAQWEGEIISQRTKDALQALKASGRPVSGPSVQPSLAARILEMSSGGASLHGIARTLNAEGVPTARGGSEWRASSVRSALGAERHTRRKKPDLPPLPRRTRAKRAAA